MTNRPQPIIDEPIAAFLQTLRLILAGVFDRFPDLQIITGHWGEVLLFYLERIDLMSEAATKLERPVTDYSRQNISVTPSGARWPAS